MLSRNIKKEYILQSKEFVFSTFNQKKIMCVDKVFRLLRDIKTEGSVI